VFEPPLTLVTVRVVTEAPMLRSPVNPARSGAATAGAATASKPNSSEKTGRRAVRSMRAITPEAPGDRN
jgi:hypothetical protein